MNWYKTNPLIAFTLFAICLGGNLSAQDSQEIDPDLFYCNENLQIRQIWPLSKSYFVANARYKTNKGNSGKLLLLFNENHLVVDSLPITSGTLNSLTPTKGNQFTMATSLLTSQYQIEDDRFVLISKASNPGGLESILSRSSNDFSDYVLMHYNGLTIGYESKAKDRTKKRSKKNIPRYYYQPEGKDKVWINSGKEEIKGDQWRSFLDRSLFALGEVMIYGDDIYFSMPMIGRCYVLNTKTKKIDTILYPEEGANSWYLTMDRVTGSFYLVGDLGKDQFSIYHVDMKDGKRTLVTEVAGFYDQIINDRVLLRQTEKEKRKKFNCFYLPSIYSFNLEEN